MDSLLCGYLRFGKAPEKIIFVIDTEATTPGGVQTANPVHAFEGEYQEQEVSGSTINSHYSIARQE